MSLEQEEARTEKMKRLLAANKVMLARNKLRQIYHQELGYALQTDQFLDINLSQHFIRRIYQQMRTVPARTLATVHGVKGELTHLKEAWRTLADQHVLLYYRNRVSVQRQNYIDAGGIKLVLKDVWNILAHIRVDEEDILVAEEGLAFGFGVEAEESGYTLSYWGLE